MQTLATYVIAVGVLAAPPRLQFIEPENVPCLDLVIDATDTANDLDWETVPTRHEVRVYDTQARNANASLGPGDRVVVAGRMTSYVFVDPATNKRYRRQRLVADVVAPSLEAATATLTPAPAEPKRHTDPAIRAIA